MKYYPHHIGDFNNATRHLTAVERALYRELMDRYYETEKPLPADDFDDLARKVLAKTDDEKTALKLVLKEFFTLENGAYRNTRCDAEILVYQEKSAKARAAGNASALVRAKNKLNGRSTDAQRTVNGRATNQEPRTIDIKPTKKKNKTEMPSDFRISERVAKWAQANGHHSLEVHFENFVMSAKAKGYTYKDWDIAFMKAIKDNWAKVPPKTQERPVW